MKGHGSLLLVNRRDLAFENVFERTPFGDGLVLRGAENLARSSLPDYASVVDGDDAIGHGEDFVAIVSDVQNRNIAIGNPLTKVVHDVRLGAGIKRGERFVEQKSLWFRNQSASKCNTLLLAAGEMFWPTIENLRNVERDSDGFGPLVACGGCESIETVGDVFAGREMREQREVLEDKADAPPGYRNACAIFGIENGLAVQLDLASVRRDKPG